MKITYCDNCKKRLDKTYHAEIFGYDSCSSKLCQSKLVLKASNNSIGTSTALIPKEEDINKAQVTTRTGAVASKCRRLSGVKER
jgi:hypothetical protein